MYKYIKTSKELHSIIDQLREEDENIAGYDVYGFRMDSFKYSVGDTTYDSHELFQDPDYDYEGNLIYPYIDSGLYAGYYDGGELNGTSAIYFDLYDDESIAKAFKTVQQYNTTGTYKYIMILGGYYYEWGNDPGEVVIRDAQVLFIDDIASVTL